MINNIHSNNIVFSQSFDLEFKCNKNNVDVFFNGQLIGDTLNDNSRSEDFYRFHDIFHFSFAFFLDWSPCVRHLLKRKRKFDPILDHVEDGARARSIEEGISAIIFEEALEKNYFEKENIETKSLQVILNSVKRLEVGIKPLEDWKLAISEAYKAFRYLVINQGGRLHFNVLNNTITPF